MQSVLIGKAPLCIGEFAILSGAVCRAQKLKRDIQKRERDMGTNAEALRASTITSIYPC